MPDRSDMPARLPGVYHDSVLPSPSEAPRTGVPAFLAPVELATPQALASAAHLDRGLRTKLQATHTLAAIAGHFAAGGGRCHVVAYDPAWSEADLVEVFAQLDEIDEVDLVAAPDLMRGLPDKDWHTKAVERASRLLTAGEQATRLTLLSAPHPLDRCKPGDLKNYVDALARHPGAGGAALYHPWVVHAGALAPPDGHVAGVIAATDARVGFHKPPANEVVRGLVDLDVSPSGDEPDGTTKAWINHIRALPGRGIRVWGARTLIGEPISVRRTILAIRREVARRFDAYAFEANDTWLWNRVAHELGTYLHELYQRGALRGRTPIDAYQVRCDAATNPPEQRAAGIVCADLAVAPATPREYINLRLRLSAQAHAASVDEAPARV